MRALIDWQAKNDPINAKVKIPGDGLLGRVLATHLGGDRQPKPVVLVGQEQRSPRIHEVLHAAGGDGRLQDPARPAAGGAASRHDLT